MSALVLGAGGFLGLNLVDALVAAGETPRCGRRARSNVLALRQRKVPLCPADLERPEELIAAMAGCAVVYHLAAHYPRHSLDGASALATGRRQTANVLDAAAAAGVGRLVFVSSTATVAPAQGGPATERHRFGEAPGWGVYHDLKWELEEQVLREQRFEVTVACPGACLGPWDLRLGTSALLVGLARGLDPPHPDGVVNLVDARDLARGLVAQATVPAPPRRLIFVAQSRPLHPLLVELAGRYRVAPPSPPLGAAAAMALADEEERRAAAGGERARLAREIVDLIVRSQPIDGRLAEQSLGFTYRPLAETLDGFDEWARRLRILPPLPALEERP